MNQIDIVRAVLEYVFEYDISNDVTLEYAPRSRMLRDTEENREELMTRTQRPT